VNVPAAAYTNFVEVLYLQAYASKYQAGELCTQLPLASAPTLWKYRQEIGSQPDLSTLQYHHLPTPDIRAAFPYSTLTRPFRQKNIMRRNTAVQSYFRFWLLRTRPAIAKGGERIGLRKRTLSEWWIGQRRCAECVDGSDEAPTRSDRNGCTTESDISTVQRVC
jgi:hypothetical protein